LRTRLLALLLGLLAPLPALARSPAVVLDDATDRVLLAVDAEQPWYPASLTKLMTLYLTFDALAKGQLDPNAKLVASEHAAQQGGTRLGLAKGATLTAMEAILATITRSANDAAVVLAERIGDSEGAFAQRMTERARVLGMTHTVFRNATGLPDPGQWTTAGDLAILAHALIHDFADRYALFGTRTMNWQGHHLPNINGLLGSFPGADGMKTGFTCGAGYNIVASAASAGRRIIAVALGATSLNARRGEITRLLQAGFTGKLPKDLVDAPAPTQASAAAILVDGRPPAIKPVLPSGCDAESARLAVAPADPLRGWALTMGNTHLERDARGLIEAAKKALGGDLRGGRPLVVERHAGALPPYRALVVGFDETHAIATCFKLRHLDIHCIVLSPELLHSPYAIWN
jgi:D-alanyl-D-alanine carboxypeptidase